MSPALTYKRAGVDVAAADRLVSYIRRRAPGVGGFSGLFPVPGRSDAFLAATTDGVGTKLKLAFLLDRHETVGIDLVAMCANDLICCGARPLFFLDYYATGRLDLERSRRILDGVLEGCRRAGMALLGGETAEMPGFYPEGEYDLAGFAVGWAERRELLDGSGARAGDLIAALPSSGLHANGFSLVRRAFPQAELRREATALLAPTRIYVDDARRLRAAAGRGLKALAHITGEGLAGNLPRVLPRGLRAVVDRSRWRVPEVFRRVQARGRVAERAMWSTFNMGVGLAAVLAPGALAKARAACPDLFRIGRVENGSGFVFAGGGA